MIELEEEREAKPIVDDILILNLGDEKDPKLVQIGSPLSLVERKELVEMLKEYRDMFGWFYEDMPGINPEIVQHHMHLYPDAEPVNQKLAF